MFAFATCCALLGPATVYVSSSGNDTNAGTIASPWRTIQFACDHVPVGGQAVVRGGVYKERVTITRSLSLLAAPGEKPVIDGTGLEVPNDWNGLVFVKNANAVTVSGFEIRNFRTTNSSRVPAGILVLGKANGVVISDNSIHDIANTGKDKNAINAFGIAVYGNSKLGGVTNLLIQNNEIHDTKTGLSETLAVNGNVDGFRILNNHIHDANNIGIACIGFEGTSPIKASDQARNGLVAGNLVENVSSVTNPAYGGERSADGIYVDGGTGITIERNTVRVADIGIEVASEHKGKTSSNVVVRSNSILRSAICGVSIGGYDAKRGGTTGCSILNNTLVQNDTTGSGTGEFQVQYNSQGNVFANNILAASSQGVFVTSVTGKGKTIGVTSDYNLFYAPSNAAWRWQGREYGTLATYQTATKLDVHSLFGDPGFIDSAGDFRRSKDARGVDVGWRFASALLGTTDLDGAPRVQGQGVDMGAFETALRKNAFFIN